MTILERLLYAYVRNRVDLPKEAIKRKGTREKGVSHCARKSRRCAAAGRPTEILLVWRGGGAKLVARHIMTVVDVSLFVCVRLNWQPKSGGE